MARDEHPLETGPIHSIQIMTGGGWHTLDFMGEILNSLTQTNVKSYEFKGYDRTGSKPVRITAVLTFHVDRYTDRIRIEVGDNEPS